MRTTMMTLAAFVVLVLLLARPAFSAVVSADGHPQLPPGLHTRAVLDETTGFLWSDMEETNGYSLNVMLLSIGPGGAFEGWLMADLAQAEQLLINAGIPFPTNEPGINGTNQAIMDFVDIYRRP